MRIRNFLIFMKYYLSSCFEVKFFDKKINKCQENIDQKTIEWMMWYSKLKLFYAHADTKYLTSEPIEHIKFFSLQIFSLLNLRQQKI